MNKRFIHLALLLSVCSAAWGEVTPIDTPLPTRYGWMSYPVDRDDIMDQEDWCLNYDVSATGYHRQANKSFSSCHGSGDSNETPVSRLLFGKEEFTLAESFVNGEVDSAVANNPFVNATTLTPHYDFEENGAMFRASINTKWCNWRIGARASIPFRSIDMKEICSGDHHGVEFKGATSKDDLYQVRKEEGTFATANGNTQVSNDVFAARMDLLSVMERVSFGNNGQQDRQNLVQYNPTIKMADVSVGGAPEDTNDPAQNNNEPFVAVIQSDDGSLPVDQRWGDLNTAISGPISGDGSGLNNGQRGRFNQSTDYTQLKDMSSQQGQLWVVPTISTRDKPFASNQQGSITGSAQQIWSAITQALPLVDDSVEDAIKDFGIDFCDGRTQSAGDFDLEFYLGYDWADLIDCADIWSEFSFGLRLPTGEEVENCKNVLKQPAGLNDHVGIRIGSEHGWNALDWLKLNLAARYTFVIEDDQKVAAPFKGATIKGFGPCITANTEWGFFEGFFNTTMMWNDCCGIDIGYQAYYQPDLNCGDIRLCQSTATDPAGREDQQLDATVLTKDTERASHKVHTAAHIAYNDCYLNFGFSHAFAGKNIIRDTDWYAGITVNF